MSVAWGAGVGMALLACRQAAMGPAHLPRVGPLEALPPSAAVLGADVDQDGEDELLWLSDGRLSDGQDFDQPLPGDFQAAVRGEVEGRETLWIATGAGREEREAPARLYRLESGILTLAWEREGERDQVTDLRVVDGRLWVASFVDAWTVEGGWLEGGSIRPVVAVRMGMRQLPLRGGDGVIVGRLYGEEPRSDGGLDRIGPDGEALPLPSLRGARSLAAGDLDGDGSEELLLGDGWHHAYRDRAVARVRLLSGPALAEARTIATLDGSYTVRELELVALADGRPAILATGSHEVVLLVQDGLGWAPIPVGPVDEAANAVWLQDGRGRWIAASGRVGGWKARVEPGP